MAGNRNIWFSAITRYCRCCFIVWACSLPFFYLIEPMCIVHMGSYSYIQSREDPLQGSCHWQLWKNHIIHVGDPVTRFPSLTATRFPVHMQTCYMVPIIDSYKVPIFTSYCKCGGPHYKVPTFHIRYAGTIGVIDSCKVPTVACPCPRGLGAFSFASHVIAFIYSFAFIERE